MLQWCADNCDNPLAPGPRQRLIKFICDVYSAIADRAPIGNLGLWDYREKKIGLWDYTLFGITEISFEIGIIDIKSIQKGIFHPCKIGIMGLHPFRNWDYGITLVLKSGLRDYVITGLPLW